MKFVCLVCGTGLDMLSPSLPCRITSSTWSLRNSSQGKANVHTTPSWTQPQPLSVSVHPGSVVSVCSLCHYNEGGYQHSRVDHVIDHDLEGWEQTLI